MAQADIYWFLEKNKGRRFSAEEIADGLGCSTNSVRSGLTAIRGNPDKRLRYFPKQKYHAKSYKYWLVSK